MDNTKQTALFDGKTFELVNVWVFHTDATVEQIGQCFRRQIPFSYHAPAAGETREYFFDHPVDGRQYLYIKGFETTDE